MCYHLKKFSKISQLTLQYSYHPSKMMIIIMEDDQCHIIVQQMLTRIIISIFLLAIASATTTLTTSNCPANFNPSTYNSSLALANQNLANSLYSSVFSASIKANITNSIAQGNLYPLLKSFLKTSFLLPYILVAAFFGLLFLVTFCCCAFQQRCPPCKSWRRNYLKQPYSNLQKRLTMFFTILFATGILIATIIVFSSFAMLRSDIGMVKCSLYYSLDITTNGNQASSWGGFGQIQSQISGITSLLNATATSAIADLSGNSWILTGLAQMQNMNLNLWNNNQDSVVYSADPVATEFAMNSSSPLPTIIPNFIQNGLGPNGTAGTMVTDIDSSFKVTQKLTTQAQATYQSAMTFSNSVDSITANTNANLQTITIVTTQLALTQLALNNFVDNYLTLITSLVIYLVEALFGLVLLSSLITLLGAISTHIFDIFACKKMVHAGWALFGLQYFGVLAVLMTMLIVGGVSYCFCQYFGDVINNPYSFSTFALQPGSNSINQLFQYLDVCFFSNGDILKKFSLTQQMGTVSALFLNVQTFLNMQTAGNAQFVDITYAPSTIMGWMNAMNQYAQGIYQDAIATPGDSNPYTALGNLNQLTLSYNSTATNKICANDYWVYDAANCTYGGSQALYVPSTDDTNGLYFPPTGTLCISLNTRISNTAPTVWSASDIAQRYLSLRSCDPIAYQAITSYAQSITNYRDSRANLYQSLYSQLSSLLTVTTTYNSNMSTFSANLNTFFSSASAINNLVTNQINGLTISNNCTAVADSFRFFYNMYCVNFINRSVKISISCLAMLVLMVGALISGSLFGVRYDRIEKELKLRAEIDGQIIKMEAEETSERSGDTNSSEQNN